MDKDDKNMENVVLTPNPYTASVNKKRLSSTGSYVQDSPYSNSSLSRNNAGYTTGLNGSNPSIRGSISSKMSIYNNSQDIKPENGCVLLGKHGTTGNKYTTRFKIDPTKERKTAGAGVFLEECCLCTSEENRRTLLELLKAIVMSEAFLLTFHLGALALGVIKGSINRENIDEDLELVHSIIEIFAVTFVLFSRAMLVRESFKNMKDMKKANQHLDAGSTKYAVGSNLYRTNLGFTILCIIFNLAAIAGFVIFYFFLHLGWTTLLNNALLIIATVVSNIILKKLQNVRSVMIADEHKVVLYESTLLMKEGLHDMTADQRQAYNKTVMTYIKALFDTDSFHQPDHIQLKDKYGPRWNTVTTMDMFSAV